MGELVWDANKVRVCSEARHVGGKVPQGRWGFINSKMEGLRGASEDCTSILFKLREVKSDWELSMIRESGEINRLMFESIRESGGPGKTELEMAGVAEEVSRSLLDLEVG